MTQRIAVPPVRWLCGGLAALAVMLPYLSAQEPAPAKPATLALDPVKAGPAAVHAGFAKAAAGKIEVKLAGDKDSVTVSMTGAVAANSHCKRRSTASYTFDVTQCFEVIAAPDVKAVKLTVEGRVKGLLRGGCQGCKVEGVAAVAPGQVVVSQDNREVVALSFPPGAVHCGENVPLDVKQGPVTVTVGPGKYVLHQTFGISARKAHSLALWRGPSAVFASGTPLDGVWIAHNDALKNADKKDLGFAVTLKVAAQK